MPRTTLDHVSTSYRRYKDWVRGELREQKKTQKELAEYLGISEVSMSQRMNGAVEWTLKDFLKTMEFLGQELPFM